MNIDYAWNMCDSAKKNAHCYSDLETACIKSFFLNNTFAGMVHVERGKIDLNQERRSAVAYPIHVPVLNFWYRYHLFSNVLRLALFTTFLVLSSEVSHDPEDKESARGKNFDQDGRGTLVLQNMTFSTPQIE